MEYEHETSSTKRYTQRHEKTMKTFYSAFISVDALFCLQPDTN